ncbi:hypothetical protein [Neolewinella agarilytica]|uniref:Uncharacterized protein n=1 Tax=Neolewinella agarilytica TaxID=478744 RepID=A0A1H9KWG5_9BACT|nr:hypothetical protein [Neolewinella agarilytica]SER03522.1 hypothetical protein SAMN05444359_12222 [Neolewinella agarilytica]
MSYSHSITSLFLLLLLPALMTNCSEDQIVEMENLERDLMLTWIALEREDEPQIAAFNDATQKDWQLMSQQYRQLRMSPAVRQSAGRINLWMVNLKNAVRHNQPKRAMMAVSLMQNELRTLRPQMGINHPADRLYDFYYQWQDVVAASNDPMMCLLDWNEYEERYELAAKSWTEYVAARPRFSDTLFPGYGRNAIDAEEAAVAMTGSLRQFGLILEQADHTLAAEPSRMIDDLFFDYLAVVTDYPVELTAASLSPL